MKNDNSIKILKEKLFILIRWIVFLTPLIVSLLLIINHLSCVIFDGSRCWHGLSDESRIFIYSGAGYFYIIYIISLIFIRKRLKRLIVAYIVTILFPFIVLGSAYLAEDPSHEYSGLVLIGAYGVVTGPGMIVDHFLKDVISRPYVNERSIRQLRASYIGKDIYVLGREIRYFRNSLIVPFLISGDYLRAIRIMPLVDNAPLRIESLFTIGPYSYKERHKLKAEYELELLNRDIIKPDEWKISEWNPQVWQAFNKNGVVRGVVKKRLDNKRVLLALMDKKSDRGDRDLWLFDNMRPGNPVNLTSLSDTLDWSVERVELSIDLNWIYVMGRINYDPLFTRMTLSGNRDNPFEQEWKAFLDTSGFARVTVDAVRELRNGCLIVAFSPHREKSYPVKWLRLAQNCSDNGFELIKIQVTHENIKVAAINELTDGNLLVKLQGWAVLKLNLKHKKVENDFQRNLIHTLQLLPAKGEEKSSEKYDWGDIRFAMLYRCA